MSRDPVMCGICGKKGCRAVHTTKEVEKALNEALSRNVKASEKKKCPTCNGKGHVFVNVEPKSEPKEMFCGHGVPAGYHCLRCDGPARGEL